MGTNVLLLEAGGTGSGNRLSSFMRASEPTFLGMVDPYPDYLCMKTSRAGVKTVGAGRGRRVPSPTLR